MCKKYKFIPIIANQKDGRFENVEFLPAVISLMEKYRHFLSDDFYPASKAKRFEAYIDLINSLYPHFYVITCDGNNVSLQQLKGNDSKLIQAYEEPKNTKGVPLEISPCEVVGFVYLSEWNGNEKRVYSAHLTCCFSKKYWGSATLECAKEFIAMVKKGCRLKKIKAQVFEHNFRIKKLLKTVGFNFEGVAKNETLQRGKPVNVVNYGLLLD